MCFHVPAIAPIASRDVYGILFMEWKPYLRVYIHKNGSDTPATRPETDNAGQSPRDRILFSGMHPIHSIVYSR